MNLNYFIFSKKQKQKHSNGSTQINLVCLGGTGTVEE